MSTLRLLPEPPPLPLKKTWKYVSKLCTTATVGRGCIILYADDILLIAPSVTMLERLLHTCEDELD